MVPSVDTMTASESQAENDNLGDELKGTKRKISLASCAVCGTEEARYRCPGCLKHSCSLPCVKKHKEDTGCNGVRDKTTFVALSQFDEMNLLSDYRFLEDTGRMADSANRDSLARTPLVNYKAKKLTYLARKMNITMRFLPSTFTRSRQNSTMCLYKEKQFLWHLQLLFPQSSSEFFERRMPDDQTLEQILTRYIHPTESEPVRRQKLKMYVHLPFDHVRVFMKVEGSKANSTRYHELDLAKTLKENLKYKTVIEYPVLHVVLKDHCQDYPLRGPVETAPARDPPVTKRPWVDNDRREVVTRVQQPQLGPLLLGPTPGSSAETEPPKEKRVKREVESEDLEDGEVRDSTGDDDGEDDKLVKESSGQDAVGHGGGGDDDDDDNLVKESSGQDDVGHGGDDDDNVKTDVDCLVDNNNSLNIDACDDQSTMIEETEGESQGQAAD